MRNYHVRGFSEPNKVHKNKEIPYIIYDSPEGQRKITVVDGQPFYCSTGTSSNMAGTWFPCLMTKGSNALKNRNYDLEYPESNKKMSERNVNIPHLKVEVIEDILTNPSTIVGYILKRSSEILQNPDDTFNPFGESEKTKKIRQILEDNLGKKISDGFFDRFAEKKDLLTSINLGGGIWENKKVQDSISKELSFDTDGSLRSRLSSNEELRTDNPYVVNQWLLDNQARDLNSLYDDDHTIIGNFRIGLLDKAIEVLKSNSKDSDGIWGRFNWGNQDEKTNNNNKEVYKKLLEPLNELNQSLLELINEKLREVSIVEINNGYLSEINRNIVEIINEIFYIKDKNKTINVDEEIVDRFLKEATEIDEKSINVKINELTSKVNNLIQSLKSNDNKNMGYSGYSDNNPSYQQLNNNDNDGHNSFGRIK